MSVPTGVATEAEDRPPGGYHERKLAGWCVYGACPRRAEGWPDPVHDHCTYHRRKRQARKRRKAAAGRAALAEAGKCIRCRKPSSTYRCPACRLLDNCEIPTVSVPTGVATDKIAAATRKDPDGRTRYHGQQRRGQQTHSQLNAQDLKMAMDQWGLFVLGVRQQGSDEFKTWHRQKREDLKVATASKGLRLIGHLEDILERMGAFQQERPSRRDGE